MHWIRAAGSALVLLFLMTSTAIADTPVQQLEDNVRASLATVGSNGDLAGPVRARSSFEAPGEPVTSKIAALEANPMITAVRHLVSLTGGWRVSAGISPGTQFLGVANGRIVEDHWTNFHLSVTLPLR